MQKVTPIFKGKDILRQLKADLIGKDSYRGVTLSYSWLANQFGHFALGYMPTLGVYAFLKSHTSWSDPALSAALIVSITWLVFETYNFLGPLLSNRHSSSKMTFVRSRRTYVFKPAWRNVTFDTVTDLGFFWAGAFSASLFLYWTQPVLITIIVLAVLLLYPSYYWYTTKLYEQYAVYPFEFRLSQWDLQISPQNRATILDFFDKQTPVGHLLVFGGRECGKTSLGVALANEYSILRYRCAYTTATKLYQEFFAPDDLPLPDDANPWNWRDSAVLVIDDINPGSPVRDDLIPPPTFLELLDTYAAPNEINRKLIRDKKVIWVMGNYDKRHYEEPKERIERWVKMLRDLGVPQKQIFCVELTSPGKSG
jgi:hypothetical protein